MKCWQFEKIGQPLLDRRDDDGNLPTRLDARRAVIPDESKGKTAGPDLFLSEIPVGIDPRRPLRPPRRHGFQSGAPSFHGSVVVVGFIDARRPRLDRHQISKILAGIMPGRKKAGEPEGKLLLIRERREDHALHRERRRPFRVADDDQLPSDRIQRLL
jgi:hypothetical protein